ncbi:hypothetical protein [Halochromatium glycolicum]|nr:hypothetical protein [Halochromatium glycolicum]
MPVPQPPEPPRPMRSRPGIGARILGALLLFWSVGLVSCQSLFFL